MDIITCVLYVVFFLANVLVMLNAFTMTLDSNSCDKSFDLKAGESLFLKFSIGNLETRKHGTNCTMKLSAPQDYNEICVQKGDTTMNSFYKLGKCNIDNIFYIHLESHKLNYKNYSLCKVSDISSLCLSVNSAYLVFAYDTDSISLEEFAVPLEIFAKGTRTRRGSTWSSWSSWSSWTSEYSDVDLSSYTNEYEDDDNNDKSYNYVLPIFLLATCLFAYFIYCCAKMGCREPLITADTREAQQESPQDSPQERLHQSPQESPQDSPSDGANNVYNQQPENREHLLTSSAPEEDTIEDPWKPPPDYDTVVRIDQSYYGEYHRPQIVIREPDPPIEADEVPPPPYPGVI